jgi:acetyl-CoA carboxylase carboxyl transferase subunit alpha
MKHALEFEKPVLKLREEIEEAKKKLAAKPNDKLAAQIAELEKKADALMTDIHLNLNPWQRVQISRHTNRPFMLDYVKHCCEDFIELHGDRHIGDDHAMPAGFATWAGKKVVVIGHQKGRDTKENLLRNFGSAHPEGYRKALRLMRLAEKFSLPIVTLIDTPGAFPGIGAEERNIAEAIAFNLREMMTLRTPVVAVVIGEGGSGGALGIGIADRVLMMENAYYSVISPEGCAAILWKHREHAPEAAAALKLSAQDLSKLGIIDGIIPEPLGGAHNDHETAAASLKDAVVAAITELEKLPTAELLEQRYQKFRALGKFTEN